MGLTRNMLVVAAASGSAALMIAALAFQHLGGLAPCQMCIWQRYPHVIAIAIGLVAIRFGNAALAWLGALAAFATAAVGAYHTGVERGWWEGPSSCSAQSIGGLTTDELFEQIMTAPVVRCDEVAWSLIGLSMASWNMIASLVLAALWIAAARRPA